MDNYKKHICSVCKNNNCNEKISIVKKKDVTVIKCENYRKTVNKNTEFLSLYVDELKFRKKKYDL